MMTTDQRAELDAAMKRATKGEWAQGHLLSTEQTRRFSFERRAYFSDIEKSTFYVDFSAEDEGRSRKRIGSTLECANDAHANAAAIVALHNAYPLLTATIDAQAAEIARLREALAAMLLTHDAGGVTLGAAKDARAALASTGAA